MFGFKTAASAVTDAEIVRLLPSEFAETFINIPYGGKLNAFSFEGRRYLEPIYDINAERLLLCFARQSEKSTTMGNSVLTRCCLREYYRTLFISPTQTQTETFSRDRITAPIAQSPKLQFYKGAPSKGYPDNVLYKKFITQSDITFRYAYLSADRSRGVSADGLIIDELQDILVDVIPIVQEAVSHSPIKSFRYAGTPKSVENTMNAYWEKFSTKCEWMIPCDACNHWNLPGEKNIGRFFLICSRCGKQIFPDNPRCQWASMRSEEWLRNPPIGSVYQGFRVPQIVVSWVVWREIIDKMEGRGYTRGQFMNEVLALAFDHADRLLTREMLRACCDQNRRMDAAEKSIGREDLYMGIDWGGGGADESSLTAVCIGGYRNGRFTYIYFKRYEGAEADADVMIPHLLGLIDKFKPRIIGYDHGGGHVYGQSLINRYGLRRLARYQYVNTKLLYFDSKLMRFMANRTEVLMALINAIRSGKDIVFPRWEDFETPFADEFLSVFQEQDVRGNAIVSKTPGMTDDTLHAAAYCLLASMIHNPRPDIISPTGPGGYIDVPVEPLDSYDDPTYEDYP
jgi:hypothetical protein